MTPVDTVDTLRESILEVFLPMYGFVQSLNVAAWLPSEAVL